MQIFKTVFNNPGKAAAVIFTAVLAAKTFVVPTENVGPVVDFDLDGIATQASVPAPHIVNIDEEK